MNPALTRIFCRILNVFENDSGSPETDYKSVYIYRDGNGGRKQVTLARGFTSDGGNLQKVTARYIQKGGVQSKFFAARLKASTPALVADREFLQMLGTVSSEQIMRDAQDEIFEEAYLRPAFSYADKYGFKLPLSVGVIVDSYLHSGSMLSKLTNAFAETKPASGGREKVWILKYLGARLAWFDRASGALHTCTFRPKFFLGEIEKENWSLSGQLRPKGVLI